MLHLLFSHVHTPKHNSIALISWKTHKNTRSDSTSSIDMKISSPFLHLPSASFYKSLYLLSPSSSLLQHNHIMSQRRLTLSPLFSFSYSYHTSPVFDLLLPLSSNRRSTTDHLITLSSLSSTQSTSNDVCWYIFPKLFPISLNEPVCLFVCLRHLEKQKLPFLFKQVVKFWKLLNFCNLFSSFIFVFSLSYSPKHVQNTK